MHTPATVADPVPHYTPADAATGTIIMLALLAVAAIAFIAARRRRK